MRDGPSENSLPFLASKKNSRLIGGEEKRMKSIIGVNMLLCGYECM